MSIKHKFNSGIPDGLDPALVKPSDWNNDHFVDFDGLSKSASGVLVQALPGVDYLTPTGSGATLTGITAAQVGLGNVTNESKATMFTSPAFTGTPTAPTAAANTNTTQIASCEFVIGQASNASPAIPQDAAVVGTSKMFARGDHGHPSNFTSSSSDLKMDGTAAVGVSTKYVRADHVHPTDTSRAPLASPTFTGTVTSPQFASTIATGTAPFTVASTTLVSNLNAQYIGGTPLSGLEPAITTLPVAKGGTGATTFTANYLLKGNGTNAVTASGVYEDASGNVGIGVIPDVGYPARLWLFNTSDCKLRIVKAGVVATTVSAVDTAMAFGCDIAAGDTERMRLTSTGNVLIGTTTDDGVNKLQVNGSAKFASNIFFNSTSGALRFGTDAGVEKASFRLAGNDLKAERGDGAEYARFVYATGNLLIGATSDDGTSKLRVLGSGLFERSDSNSVTGGQLRLRNLNGETRMSLFVNQTDNTVGFVAGGSIVNPAFAWRQNDGTVEHMRLTSAGNLLIGTTSDDGVNKLQVNGSIKAIGSLYSNGGGGVASNSCTGYQALLNNTTGVGNTANGYAALCNNTTGSNNTANGSAALYNNTGTNNTANGYAALYYNTTGTNNTADGYQALYNNTTGSGNICIGSLNSAGSYAPVYNCTTENDRVVIGSTSVTNAYVNVAWTIVSDRRDKTNIVDIPVGLDFISQLTPVRYERKLDRESIEGDGITRYGFIAQDVLAIEGDAPVIVDSENAEHLRINETSIIAVLVKAVQELKAEFEEYKVLHP